MSGFGDVWLCAGYVALGCCWSLELSCSACLIICTPLILRFPQFLEWGSHGEPVRG